MSNILAGIMMEKLADERGLEEYKIHLANKRTTLTIT